MISRKYNNNKMEHGTLLHAHMDRKISLVVGTGQIWKFI
jgi:hypothetical protein